MNPPAPKSWFLGPKAENQDYFEHMLLEAFRDYCYWRRNFHPEDQAYIRAEDRLEPAFLQYQENLHDHLFAMLSELKQSTPFFSPRYLGHMCKDLLIPGTLGYIAAMFYNQNNITQEAATITTRFEAEALQMIGRMLGYPLEQAWGHLCSGGTVANIEALWVARNVSLLPWQLALLYQQAPAEQQGRLQLLFAHCWDPVTLSSLNIPARLQLFEQVRQLAQRDPALSELFKRVSLVELGLLGFYQRCEHVLGAAPPRLRVAYSQNAHYSLRKSLGLLGLGEEAALQLPLDAELRLDVAALERVLAELPADQLLMAVVGVYGSTEEGAIDDFDRLVSLRQQLEDKGKGGFWLHGDACYGGYALSLLAAEDDDKMEAAASLQMFLQQIALPAQERSGEKSFLAWSLERCQRWLRVSGALSACDSIALDPHKLGYLPYPSGSLMYRDYLARELIRCDAPYINATEQPAADHWQTPYPGKYTLEGSRPGATSAAAWLAHQTVPLNRQGHGRLVAGTLISATYLQQVLATEIQQHLPGLDCRFLNLEPDLNILCYTISGTWQGQVLSLYRCNQLVEKLYQLLLAREQLPQKTQDFMISMTRLERASYGEAALNVYWQRLATGSDSGVVAAGLGRSGHDDHYLALIRTVVMDPFLAEAVSRKGSAGSPTQPLARHYAQTLARLVKELLTSPELGPLA